MCGRNEKYKSMENKIKIKLQNAPDLIKKYFNSIWLTTEATTRYVYLTYLLHFNNFLTENNIEITSVKPMDIDSYITQAITGKDGKMNGFQIINARLSAIISFYDFLVENEIISNNPCSKKKKLKVDKKDTVVYMTPEEVNKIKKAIYKGVNRQKKYINRDLAIVELGCTTGLRVSAIVNIDIDDIDFDANSINVIEKGNKKRTIYFGENTKNILLKWIEVRNNIIDDESTNALFISKLKKRMSKDAVNDMLKSAVKVAGINKNITPHKMRSTCGMNLYNKTGDIYLTQNILGHSNIKNTMIYVKATEEQERKAANILDSYF